MANLKRNMIEIVKDVKEGELVTEQYWTPLFIPMSIVYEAMDLLDSLDNDGELSEKDKMERLIDFIAKTIYKDQFTADELRNGLHAPQALETLYAQIIFVAQGVQTDETKKYLDQKR